ncbi:MAG: ketopantoate reductase family protein [Anaerolineae bacterium]
MMKHDTKPQPRLLLMGCGAVGGVIAGGLLRHGHDLTIVTHNEKIQQALVSGGLRLTTPEGAWSVDVRDRAHVDLADTTGPFDVALLAMKATDVEDAARAVVEYLTPAGFGVTLQNGIVEDPVAELIGSERVVGALVGWGTTMHAPGVYEMTSQGETIIGELDGSETPRVRQLRQILASATATTVSTNIYGALWSKLAINCVVTTLGAVTGQLLGEMLIRAEVRRLALSIVSEAIDVAEARDVDLEPVGGTLDIHRLYLAPERRGRGLAPDKVLKHAIMLAVGLKFRKLKSSMLQSLERGREPEIAYMNGYVVEKGRAAGIATPINAALVEMVREIAAGKRPVAPENLQELPQA